MSLQFRFDASSGVVEADGKQYPLDHPEAFRLLSQAWLRSGWDKKYVYGFSWLGRPIIQLPEDLLALQELIFNAKPDVIVETGVAHGGSLVFFASLCKAMNHGRVIGVDIDIRPHNRKAIEEHFLHESISLIEGSSIDVKTIQSVQQLIKDHEKVLVILDSNHSKDHVLEELRQYSRLISPGGYIVACDGIMQDLVGAPRSSDDWDWNNPVSAINQFLNENPSFIQSEAPRDFNEGSVLQRVTYWPQGYLQRVL